VTGLADSAYTATDPGWGVWFVAAVLLLAGLFAVAVWAVRAAGRWARSLVARRRVGRRRWVVGEVGIGGIKADAPYRCENGRLVEVDR
jgi:hypothetical protein